MSTIGSIGDPEIISEMLASMPDGVSVTFGGKTGGGNFEHVPEAIFEEPSGPVVGRPSVVVAAGFFPNLGLDDAQGRLRGVGRKITIESALLGETVWVVHGIEPGTAPGEIRLVLSNS